jgi:hypothetical protein
MKRLIIVFALLGCVVAAAVVAVKMLPYYLYNQAINGKSTHKLYKLTHFRPSLLNPNSVGAVGEYDKSYSNLWREFHLRDVVIPLPAGHPLYKITPFLKQVVSLSEPQLGLVFTNPSGREMARVHLLQAGVWSNQLEAQKLFKLPIVQNELKKKSDQDVWRDIFSMKIEGWDLPWQTMVYNLYILHLRASMIPQNILKFGLMPDGNMAYVEIPSKNKDYKTEIIFSFDRGLLLSYLLVTDRNSFDSREIRSRFIEGIKFRTTDKSLSQLIYREFKQLSFRRQTDSEGMLYLFSAWSHDPDNIELIKEMIYYLERGLNNSAQLRPIYRYAFSRFKKTFTTRDIGTELDDPDIKLQRKIELEEIAERASLQLKPKMAPKAIELTPKEQLNQHLKKAKEEKAQGNKIKKRKKLIIY